MVENQRKTAYSRDDIRRFLDLIEKERDIFLNKRTDAATNKMKEDSWGKVVNDFNGNYSHGSVYRDKESLKLKWDNLKKKSRQRCAAIKMNALKTGSGKSVILPDDVLDRVAEMIGAGTCSGYLDSMGSDRQHFSLSEVEVVGPESEEILVEVSTPAASVMSPNSIPTTPPTSIWADSMSAVRVNPPTISTPSALVMPSTSQWSDTMPADLGTETSVALRDELGTRARRVTPMEKSAILRNEAMARYYNAKAEYYERKAESIQRTTQEN